MIYSSPLPFAEQYYLIRPSYKPIVRKLSITSDSSLRFKRTYLQSSSFSKRQAPYYKQRSGSNKPFIIERSCFSFMKVLEQLEHNAVVLFSNTHEQIKRDDAGCS